MTETLASLYSANGLSPMMQQYRDIKNQNTDSILFFRMGDFYEMYFDDALLASQELDITLTRRSCGTGEKAPSCGVPYHSCEAYIQRLVDKGYKVAVCDPVKTEKQNGVQQRRVVRIISPGTIIDSSSLKEGENNFLCVVSYNDGVGGVCYVDISTGKLFLTEFSGEDCETRLIEETGRMNPSEVTVNQKALCLEEFMSFVGKHIVSPVYVYEDADLSTLKNAIADRFGQQSLGELERGNKNETVSALGHALFYIQRAHSAACGLITEIDYYTRNQYMEIDSITQQNLNLTENRINPKATLLQILDYTDTAMGRRQLRQYLLKPLTVQSKINRRLDAVEYFVENKNRAIELKNCLKGICDLERILSKIVCYGPTIKDFAKFKSSLDTFCKIKELLGDSSSALLRELGEHIDSFELLRSMIDDSIDCDRQDETTCVRRGFDEEHDRLTDIIESKRQQIKQITEQEEASGAKGLKVKYSKNLGYYIELAKNTAAQIPEHYILRQQLTNCSRYSIERLDNANFELMQACEAALIIQSRIFDGIREQIGFELMVLQRAAHSIAEVDVICSFAKAAKDNNYIRPSITLDDTLQIIGARHPIVEKFIDGFVANDALLDCGDNRTIIITGPNMSGKSTYMRQIALITIMAQMGCFVPAQSASIPIADKIFARIGAFDSISEGKSTFMTEMEECANIISSATEKSLILLDEIGRGTSTYDGMAIACAVLEFCNDKNRLGAKTIFATHYHELCRLENRLDGVKNYSVSAQENNGELVFTRKVKRGQAPGSYGIKAAKTAGMRQDIIDRAEEIYKSLRNDNTI